MLQYLMQHPERGYPDNARPLRRLTAHLTGAFQTLEYLKPRLEARHQSYLAAQQPPQPTTLRGPGRAKRSSKPCVSVEGWLLNTCGPPDHKRKDGAATAPVIDSQEVDRNFALDVAIQEFNNWERMQLQRRQTVANTNGKGVVVDHTGAVIRRVPAADRTRSRRSRHGETAEEWREREGDEDMMESIRALALGIELPEYKGDNKRKFVSEYGFEGFPPPPREVKPRNQPSGGKWTGSYPTIPQSQHSPSVYIPPPPLPLLPTPPPFTSPPVPPKILTSDAPALPPKVIEQPATPSVSVPHQFSMPATLESGVRLRTLFLPSALRTTFLAIAQDNTDANLETCGVLCGQLIQNALFVSRLVIPEQEATSDTCATKDEEGLFEYCFTEDLMVFGWIHTHPTQSCFMSSVDLHTHAGYQHLMTESIAIVCAPSRDPS